MRANKLIFKSGKIQEMSLRQVQEIIGRDVYKLIKAKDHHPFFVELLVAHTGISRGKILGAGISQAKAKLWREERIKELVEKLKGSAVPVYLFHNADNSERKKVGEIVSAYLRKVKGALSAIALGYISDPDVRGMLKRGELDTCSLEAELLFEKEEPQRGPVEWVVNAIEKVSGLALGSKRFARPGFSGAMVLAQAEEFEDGLGELEQRLKEKDEELGRLKEELARFQAEREQEERRRRVEWLVERGVKGRGLKSEEQKHLIQEVSERIELKKPSAEVLEEEVRKEAELMLARLLELKRFYQRAAGVRVSLEQKKTENVNPLIPEEDNL